MTAKMEAAWRAAEQGCTTVIANGKMTNSILHASCSAHHATPSELSHSESLTGMNVDVIR